MSTLIWRAAGPDDALASAVISTRSARPGSVAEVLAATRNDFPLRAARSQVLGSACSTVDVAERWLREEPRNADALLLYARTTVARAVRSVDAKERHWQKLAEIALRACRRAIAAAPEDPTPLTALLTLARLGHTPQAAFGRFEDPAEIKGPWDLFNQIRELDRLHREGHIRFLHCLGSDADRLHFAMHVANNTPLGSDPQLLVLVALVEQYRSKGVEERASSLLDGQWRLRRNLRYSLDLFDHWFPRARARRHLPITDLSYLAHALWAGDGTAHAYEVLRAMGPYGCAQPWSVFGDPEAGLMRARAQCHLGAQVFPPLGGG